MIGHIRSLLGLQVFVGLFHETSMKRGGGDDRGLRVSNGERLLRCIKDGHDIFEELYRKQRAGRPIWFVKCDKVEG